MKPAGSLSRIPGAAQWAALPRRMQAIIGVGVLGAVVLVVVVLGSQDGVTPLPDPSAAARESLAEGPLVPPVDPCDMLTFEELDVAMGLLDLPMEQRNVVTYGGGEACTWVNDRDGVEVEGLSVIIQPGALGDFEPGGQLDGVAAEPVDGVGLAAVWFPGTRDGTLSVVDESRHGYLFVRVSIARPDLEANAILPVARDVALAVLPRFPGMGPVAGEAVTTIIEPEPADVPPTSWIDNLLAREADGDWTLGEGLVATLRVFAGEQDPSEVAVDPSDLIEGSGSAVVSMARAYLQDGPDDEAKAEILRLLGLLVFTREELEAVAEPAAAQPVFELASVRAQAGPDPALRAGGPCGAAPDPCLVEFRSTELTTLDSRYGAGDYRIYHYSNSADAGWDLADFFTAANAMQRSAFVYEPLAEDAGGMPPVIFLFTMSGRPGLLSDATPLSCTINVNPAMQLESEASYKQLIAQHMAYCLFAAKLPEHGIETNGSGLWWADALAWHLSNSAYPATNLEWAFSPTLAAQELGTDLFHRTASNAMFFQHLWSELGRTDSQVLQFIRRLTPGASGDAETVASHGEMPRIFHLFGQRATDSTVPDSGGGTVTYRPDATTVSITGAPHHYAFNLKPFWTARVRFEIPAGQKACLDYAPAGTSRMTWRPGVEGPADAGIWRDALPGTLQGSFVVVVTTTQPGESPTLSVTGLVPADEPDCDPLPTPAASCLPIICSPSDFFKSITNAPSWFSEAIE